MPLIQSAQVATFDFGAPTVAATVARFRVGRGGEVDFTFLNDGENPLTVSIEVSSDDSTYAATTDANNGKAVTNLVVPVKVTPTKSVLLRADIDKYFRIVASGATRFQMQMRKQEQAGVSEIQH
jgi:hypothetical protein